MGRLRLNDASFSYEMETSAALGFGFRCGFLGLLHLEIIQERLEREFNLNLIATAPSVIYKIKLRNGQSLEIQHPVDMPDPNHIEETQEPWIEAPIGGKIIARETVRAFRKDVTAKCYGGDVSRKRKLLDKQKEGKKRMRQFGKVDIPQEAFIAALKVDV